MRTTGGGSGAIGRRADDGRAANLDRRVTAVLQPATPFVEPRLLAALDRASARPLVSLLAGHGSGKSALLEHWAEQRGVPVLVATEADADPHHLTVRLVTALTHGRGGSTPPDLGAVIDADAPLDVLVDRIVAAAEDPPTRVAIDEVDRLVDSRSIDLMRALCAVPGSRVRLVTASRIEVGLTDESVRSRGAAAVIDARELALRPTEIARRLDRAIAQAEVADGRAARSGPGWAEAVGTATGGWAAGVDAVSETLIASIGDDGPAVDGDGAVGGGAADGGDGAVGGGAADGGDGAVGSDLGDRSVAAELTDVLRAPAVMATVEAFLLREERPAARQLVAEVALLDVTDARELAAVQQRSVDALRTELDDLLRRGLIRPGPGRPGYLDVGTVTVTPLVRVAVLEWLAAGDADEPDRALVEVLDGLERAGQLGRLLQVLVAVGAQELTARMLTAHGDRLLADGRAAAVARAAASVGGRLRTPQLERLHGEALALIGDDAGALTRLAAAGRDDDPTSVLGRVRLLVQRGELRQALEQGTPMLGAGGADDAGGAVAAGVVRAELAIWLATAHLRRGEQVAAIDAITVARALIDPDPGRGVDGDPDPEPDGGPGPGSGPDERSVPAIASPEAPRIRARLRIVEAALAAGEEAGEVYEHAHRRAFAAAEMSGDARLIAQVRIDRARHHLDVGRTTEALFELDRAQGLLSDRGAVVEVSEARALRAEVLLRTGRIDAAAEVADGARRADERRHARTSARGWYLLGDVHRQRGELRRARDAYERAIAIADESGDQRPLAAASIGLARVLARTDRAAAWRAVDAALGQPTPVTGAVLAAAWLALAEGDHDVARDRAQQAVERATPRHDERALAESATLLALLDGDPVPGLRRTARTWHRLHDPVWAARTELGIARRAHGLDERSRIGDLELRLARLGTSIHRGEVAHELVTGLDVPAPVAIRVLGGFTIHHAGTRVDAMADGPRDAAADRAAAVGAAVADLRGRRIVQLLALRRGRSVAREEVLAWLGLAPDDDAGLASALVAARALVTSVDGRAVALSGTSTAFTLRSAGIDLDLEVVERRAEAGLRAWQEGRPREAAVLLRAAAAADGGALLAGEEHSEQFARVVAPVERRLAAVRARIEAGLRAADVSLGSIEADADEGDRR